ncbi:MAG: ABC transporter ATP-binding protein [Chloroflexi bacterium]|nr:ABC transporter ATP-binding protein [Chloroflexota bacterium]
MLSLRGIKKRYEGQWLLNGVDLDVSEGELLCLLGESGSGKSTLLRITAGLEETEAGRVFWNCQDITDLQPNERCFGLMFQDYALFPHRTVAQNVAFGLRMKGLPRHEVEQKVTEALKTIHMASFADRQVTELSGGEQQRVALARALAPDPHLLMLDEPLGALDHTLRVSLIHELRRILHGSGKPAIYVTHDREEAFAIADRLAVLHEGHIMQTGAPELLFKKPVNAWLASFLGLGNLIKAMSAPPNTAAVTFGCFTFAESINLPEKSACALLFRPKDLLINAQPLGAVNTFDAKVIDSVFMGDYWQVNLRVQGLDLEAHSGQPHPAGTSVTVTIPPEKIQVLPQ